MSSVARGGARISTKPADVNAAMRRNPEAVVTSKKFTGGRNVGVHTGPANAAKIEADEVAKVPRVTQDFAKAMQAARLAKNLTQSDLAKLINEKPSLIQEYENGRGVPNGGIVQKIQKHLGKLPKATEKPKPVKEDGL